jgi:hypothetical protein
VKKDGKTYQLKCSDPVLCKIIYKREATPMFLYIYPNVVHKGMKVDIYFDPRWAQIWSEENLEIEDTIFLNAKIDGTSIDFNEFIDSSRTQLFLRDRINRIEGIVGDQQISHNQDVSMLWETGNAVKDPVYSKTCYFNMSDCYEVKTLPVIYEMSQN